MLTIPPIIPPIKAKIPTMSYGYQTWQGTKKITAKLKILAARANMIMAPKTNPIIKIANLTQQRARNPPPTPTKIDTKKGTQRSLLSKVVFSESLSAAIMKKHKEKAIKNPAMKMTILISLRPKSKNTIPTPRRPSALVYNTDLLR